MIRKIRKIVFNLLILGLALASIIFFISLARKQPMGLRPTASLLLYWLLIGMATGCSVAIVVKAPIGSSPVYLVVGSALVFAFAVISDSNLVQGLNLLGGILFGGCIVFSLAVCCTKLARTILSG